MESRDLEGCTLRLEGFRHASIFDYIFMYTLCTVLVLTQTPFLILCL